MPKIENYQIKTSPLTAQDKWIGTDSAGNITKNFTPKGIADFINETDLVTVAGQSLFKWQGSAGPRELGSMSYPGFGGDGDVLSSLTSFLISTSNYAENFIGDYMPSLVNQNIILVEVDESNNFVIGKVSFISPDATYTGMNSVGLTVQTANGNIKDGAHYALAVYPGAPAITPPGTGGSDAFYLHDQGLPAQVWTVNHNLNKYPSCTIVDTAGTVVEGQVDYINENSLTITLNGATSGEAFIN
tara:strand:- start:359 stop:1090 length:732 start_codon:yes stop_codon:yes gene_type:complete